MYKVQGTSEWNLTKSACCPCAGPIFHAVEKDDFGYAVSSRVDMNQKPNLSFFSRKFIPVKLIHYTAFNRASDRVREKNGNCV